jgi:hypothetical protein
MTSTGADPYVITVTHISKEPQIPWLEVNFIACLYKPLKLSSVSFIDKLLNPNWFVAVKNEHFVKPPQVFENWRKVYVIAIVELFDRWIRLEA